MASLIEQINEFRTGLAANSESPKLAISGIMRESHLSNEIRDYLKLPDTSKIYTAYLGTNDDPTKTFHPIHFEYNKSNVVHFMPDDATDSKKEVEFLVYKNARFVGQNVDGTFYNKPFQEFSEANIIDEDKVTTSPQTSSHANPISV